MNKYREFYIHYLNNTFKKEMKFSPIEPNLKDRLNSPYIKRVKERGGPLSNIIFELEYIVKKTNDISKNTRMDQLRILVDIYYSLGQILNECYEIKDSEYINIYRGKPTINEIQKELIWIEEFDFDGFYDTIRENCIYGYDNYEYENDDDNNNELTLDDFICKVDSSIKNIFKVIDKYYEYKKKRKKLRYRKKSFKKKSSIYFKYLYEGKSLDEISQLCNVRLESVKKFIGRKVKDLSELLSLPYIPNELLEEILLDLDITKEELEYFIKVYVI